jgi:O-antigen/teichoic acid export membrane protein
MAFIMGLNLYTVRVVMNQLGIVDYGIYNVVAGFTSMFSFLSQTISISTQRYFSYAIGENNLLRLNQIYNISFLIFIILSVIIVIMCETLGLWFINTHLNIPADRIYAANCIYQFSVISFICTMLSIPYTAAVLAHEDMGVYALVGFANYLLILILSSTLELVKSD